MSQGPHDQYAGPPKPSEGPFQPPANSSGGMWKVLLIILAAMSILCCGTCSGFLYFFKNASQSVMGIISVQGTAESAIRRDAAALEKLGEPLHFGEMRNIDVKNANFTVQFDVSGSKTNATATVNAILGKESPDITGIELRCADGTVMKIDPKAAQAAANDPTNINLPEFEMPEEDQK